MKSKYAEPLYTAMSIFPVTLAFALFSGVGIIGGVITAVIFSLFGLDFRKRGTSPVFVMYLALSDIIFAYGHISAFISLFISGLLFFLLSLFDLSKISRLSKPRILMTVFYYFSALLMIIHMTTYYFDVGASGANFIELLKSYRYNGFLANWNTVLYGTIALVVMITYPRKFKSFSKKVPASFILCAVSGMLMLITYAGDYVPVIPLVGDTDPFAGDLISSVLKGSFWNISLVNIAVSSSALFILLIILTLGSGLKTKKEIIITASANALSGLSGAFSPAGIGKTSFRTNIFTAVYSILLYILMFYPVKYLPLSVPAVILIVLSFQSIPRRNDP